MTGVHAPANRRTVVRTRRHSSMVTDYHFTVVPASPDGVLAGTLEITASQWIFPGTPRRLPLQARHQVTAGMFHTFFELAVIPEIDVIFTFTDATFSGNPRPFSKGFAVALLLLFVLIAAVALWVLQSAG